MLSRLIPPPGALRQMAIANFIDRFGNGLLMTIDVLFFTRVIGLTAPEVGLGLSIAAGVGLLASLPAGHLADRFGPRDLSAVFQALEGCAVVLLCFTHTFLAFTLVSTLIAVLGSAGRTLSMVTIAALFTGEERVGSRAYLRAVVNAGIGLGTAVAGIALALDRTAFYYAIVLVNAATFLVAAWIQHRLPYVPPAGAHETASPFTALRDRAFVKATVLNGLFNLHFSIQNIAVPIWLYQHTRAPRWLFAILMLINTMSVLAFQVRVSRRVGSGLQAAGTTMYRAGLLVAGACVLYAAAYGLSPMAASVLLMAGAAVHVAGELYGSTGSWIVGFEMAREDLQGQYQGLFAFGWSCAHFIAPAFLTAIITGWGRGGWVCLAVIFVVTGALFRALVDGHVAARAA